MIERVVQVRDGDPHDIPSLAGVHIAEKIDDPYVANHLMNQILHTLFTGWPGETLIPFHLETGEIYRIVTIEKADADRVMLFVRPAVDQL